MGISSFLTKFCFFAFLIGRLDISRSAEISRTDYEAVSNTASFIKSWAGIVRQKLKSEKYRQILSKPLELSLAEHLNVRDVYTECIRLLPTLYEEFSSNMWIPLSKSVLLELCGLINPLNSEECLALSVPEIQWALSLQTYAQARLSKMVDLRGICVMVSNVMPSRPFTKLIKRNIEKSCLAYCSSRSGYDLVSQFDSALCSSSTGFCEAMDFTQSSEFPSLNAEDFGICLAIAVISGEQLPSLKLSYRDGCRFIQFWKKELGKSFYGFKSGEIEKAFRKKFQERLGLLKNLKNSSATISTISRDISSAVRGIMESETPKLKKKEHELTDSETSVSLSDDESSVVVDIDHEKLKGLGPAAQGWARILYSKYHEFYSSDLSYKSFKSIVQQISSRDTFQSCVDALVGSSDFVVSYSVAKKICRYIDPFSYESCIHLNVFDLSYAINLRNTIEKHSEQIDLRDICKVVGVMDILDNVRNHLQSSCESQLKRSEVRRKYHLSNSAISKACRVVNFTSSFYYKSLSMAGKKYLRFLVKNLSSEVPTLKVYISIKGKLDFPSYEGLVKMVDRVDDLESREDCVDGLTSMLKHYKVYRRHNIESVCEKVDSLVDRYYRPSLDYHYYPSTSFRREPLFYRSYQPMLGFTSKGYYYFPDGTFCYFDGNRYLYKSKWYYRVGAVFYEDPTYIANIPAYGEPRYYYDGISTFQIWQVAPGFTQPLQHPRVHDIVYRNGAWYHRGTDVLWSPTDIVHRTSTNTTTRGPLNRFRHFSV